MMSSGNDEARDRPHGVSANVVQEGIVILGECVPRLIAVAGDIPKIVAHVASNAAQVFDESGMQIKWHAYRCSVEFGCIAVLEAERSCVYLTSAEPDGFIASRCAVCRVYERALLMSLKGVLNVGLSENGKLIVTCGVLGPIAASRIETGTCLFLSLERCVDVHCSRVGVVSKPPQATCGRR